MTLVERITLRHPDIEFLVVEGFDEAVIGMDHGYCRFIYSVTKCLDILEAQGMDHIDAVEYFEFNVAGAHMGDNSPIFCDDDF